MPPWKMPPADMYLYTCQSTLHQSFFYAQTEKSTKAGKIWQVKSDLGYSMFLSKLTHTKTRFRTFWAGLANETAHVRRIAARKQDNIFSHLLATFFHTFALAATNILYETLFCSLSQSLSLTLTLWVHKKSTSNYLLFVYLCLSLSLSLCLSVFVSLQLSLSVSLPLSSPS